jgi:hypothetical protein
MPEPSKHPDRTQQWLRLVAKLTTATQNKDVQWQQMGTSYEAEFMGRNFRLSRSRSFGDEGIVLAFIDPFGGVEFEVPQIEGLWDLYEAVRLQAANIDEFLEKLG